MPIDWTKVPGLEDEKKIDWSKAPDATAHPPENIIEAQPTGPMHWLENFMGDVRYGGPGTTLPGKALNILRGGKGLYSGNTERLGEFMGGPLIGLPKALHGVGEMVTGKNKAHGFNDAFTGTMQTLPFLSPAKALPLIVPSLGTYGPIQAGGEKIASKFGANPDQAEAVGNALTLFSPLGKSLMPRAGRFIENNAGPIGDAVGTGAGVAKTVKTGNPLWLLGAHPAAKVATKVASGVGKAVRTVGETPMLPHEVSKFSSPAEAMTPRAVRGQLPKGPLIMPPATVEDQPGSLENAKSQIVRDPVTGKMKKQFLTGVAEEGEKPTPPAKIEPAFAGPGSEPLTKTPETGSIKEPLIKVPDMVPGNTDTDVTDLKAKYGIEDKPVLDRVGAEDPIKMPPMLSREERVARMESQDMKPTENEIARDYEAQRQQVEAFLDFARRNGLGGSFRTEPWPGTEQAAPPTPEAKPLVDTRPLEAQPLTKTEESPKINNGGSDMNKPVSEHVRNLREMAPEEVTQVVGDAAEFLADKSYYTPAQIEKLNQGEIIRKASDLGWGKEGTNRPLVERLKQTRPIQKEGTISSEETSKLLDEISPAQNQLKSYKEEPFDQQKSVESAKKFLINNSHLPAKQVNKLALAQIITKAQDLGWDETTGTKKEQEHEITVDGSNIEIDIPLNSKMGSYAEEKRINAVMDKVEKECGIEFDFAETGFGMRTFGGEFPPEKIKQIKEVTDRLLKQLRPNK